MIPRVQPGQTVDRSAQRANEIAAAVNWATARMLGEGRAARGSGGTSLLVRNDATADVTRGQLLGVDGVVISPADDAIEFQYHPALKGILPATPTHIGLWALALESIASGGMGQCAASGLYCVPLTVNHADHPRADVANASHALTSNWYGAAEILWKAASSGSTYGVVRLGPYVSETLKATADGAITAGSSGSVTIQKAGSGSQQVTAHLNWMAGSHDVANGDELAIRFFRDENKWVIINAEC